MNNLSIIDQTMLTLDTLDLDKLELETLAREKSLKKTPHVASHRIAHPEQTKNIPTSNGLTKDVRLVPIEQEHYGKWQRTVAKACTFQGQSLHTNQPSTIVVHEAPADHGIVFVKPNGARIAVDSDYLQGQELCTVIRVGEEKVQTIEHLMAAFAACGINNALIETSGDEMPILDGSAIEYVTTFAKAGLKEYPVARQFLRLRKPWHYTEGERTISFTPIADRTQASISVEIDFHDKIPAIGRQHYHLSVTPMGLCQEVMSARTFGLESERLKALAHGQALGSTPQNAVLYDDDGQLLTPGKLRFDNECVRHKMLDLIGDLYVAHWPIIAEIHAVRPGHTFNGNALRGLLASGATVLSTD